MSIVRAIGHLMLSRKPCFWRTGGYFKVDSNEDLDIKVVRGSSWEMLSPSHLYQEALLNCIHRIYPKYPALRSSYRFFGSEPWTEELYFRYDILHPSIVPINRSYFDTECIHDCVPLGSIPRFPLENVRKLVAYVIAFFWKI